MRSVALEDTAVSEWASSAVSTRAVGTYEHDEIRLYVGLRAPARPPRPRPRPGGGARVRNALLELAEGLVLDHFDDREPTFTPVLAQAAKDLADVRLTDAELSPSATAAQRRRIRPGLTALDLAQR